MAALSKFAYIPADTAVVVGLSGATGLAVIRALAPCGVSCHAVHFDGATASMATRLARPHVCPDWRADPDGLVEFLIALAERLDRHDAATGGAAAAAPRPVASLFVCHDAALHTVWAADERLRAAGLRPTFTARRSLDDLLDKRTQMAAAEAAGVATPWTLWGTAAELLAAAGDCPYPAIVKPAFSHLGAQALGVKALRCADARELRIALGRIEGLEVLLQEFVPGGDDELYTAGVFVCENGHLAFTGRKLKQHPPGLGIARLAETVDEPGLVPGSVALLRELGYEGVSQVEYKRDQRDGSYRLMEANFRPWTWIGLATACGTNLPLAAHRWALGEEAWAAVAAHAAADGARGRRAAARPRRWVWLVPEARYVLRDLSHGVTPQLDQWRGVRAEAFFSRNDPSPFLHLLRGGAGALLRKKQLGGRLRAAKPAVRRGLIAPAVVLDAAALRAEWRRGGARSFSGAPPIVELPGRGTALVLAPHPDDETIMCGATVAALRRRGDDVRVVSVTSGGATTIGVPAGAARDAAAATGIGALRVAELRSACAALGVDDVAVWGFADRAVAAERPALAARIRATLDETRPGFVYVPFPRDGHADHVAVALAAADALETWLALGPAGNGKDASGPRVLCGAVEMPLDPAWATRLVPGGATWAARRAALSAYVSRDRTIFVMPALLARLHPARPLRAVEAFVELSATQYVRFVRAMESEGLTSPGARAGGHVLSMTAHLLRTASSRERVAALLRQATQPGAAAPTSSCRTAGGGRPPS
ncbi:MAG: PIG-L family deacetylase [Actinobacteria bacterium]|nr:PIG-L family deacetylase [Actinomycetota bacterium]